MTVVEAKLIETTSVPTLASIAPYRQALIVHTYEVERVVSGECKEPRLLVAHWAIVGGKTLPPDKRKGETYALTLEPYSRHKELEGERLVMAVDDLTLPLFYDVGRE